MTEVLPAPSSIDKAFVTPETALYLCNEAHNRVLEEAKKGDRGTYATRQLAADAFCRALPTLGSLADVRAFVACVAYALAAGIIEGPRASRLLYAAQVAKTAIDALLGLNNRIVKEKESSRR